MLKNRTLLLTLMKVVPLALLMLSFAGLLDATYLTKKHYEGLAVGCLTIGGCDRVTSSSYATVGNTPVALFGAGYYLAVFILVIMYFSLSRPVKDGKSHIADFLLAFAARFTVIGFLASIWFVYLQLFVIKAICVYCMVSAGTSTLLFIFGILLLRIKKAMSAEGAKEAV